MLHLLLSVKPGIMIPQLKQCRSFIILADTMHHQEGHHRARPGNRHAAGPSDHGMCRRVFV